MNALVILYVSLVLLAPLGAGCGEGWAEAGDDSASASAPDTG